MDNTRALTSEFRDNFHFWGVFINVYWLYIEYSITLNDNIFG